jgi:hypothetical protein
MQRIQKISSMHLQSSGGKSSSEVLSKNEPRVFLKMLKVLSSCDKTIIDEKSRILLKIKRLTDRMLLKI